MPRFPLSRLLPLWIVLALALPVRGEAQPKPGGSEAWVLGLDLGGGYLSMTGDSLGRDSGWAGEIHLGHIVAPRFIAGLNVRLWSASGTDSLHGSTPGTTDLSRSVRIVTLSLTGYPAGRGFYVRGGAGVCAVGHEFVQNDPLGGASATVTHQDAGFATTAAAGWEHRLGRRIGLEVDVEYARFVAAHVGGNLVTYTAGLNAYW